jgi:DNA integrity scanning protein DisA with diadenylate cyclase activity
MIKRSLIFIIQVAIGVIIALSLTVGVVEVDKVFSQVPVVRSQPMEILPTNEEQKIIIELNKQIQQLNFQKIGAIRTIASIRNVDLSKYQIVEIESGGIKFVPIKEEKGKP